MNLNISSGMLGGLNTKTRRKTFGTANFAATLVVGIVFVVAGIAMYRSTNIDPQWVRVDGQVISNTPYSSSSNTDSSNGSGSSTTYTQTVGYSVKATTYKVTSSLASNSQAAIGSSKSVAYNPANPAEAKIVQGSSSKLFAAIFAAIGLFIVVVAPFAYLRSKHRGQAIASLQQSGVKVTGLVVNILSNGPENVDANRSQNGTSGGYKIVVAAPDLQNVTQQYTSDSLSGLGGLAISDFATHAIPIDVYLDPSNPANYYVDISDIPNLTADRIKDMVRSMAQPAAAAAPPPVAQAPQTPVAQAPQQAVTATQPDVTPIGPVGPIQP